MGGLIKGIVGAGIVGPLMTENQGIERIIANVISNTAIRAIVVAGEEVKGHQSGQALLSLLKNGIETEGKQKGRIIGANGAMPFIMNLRIDAINRFRMQVKAYDLIGITSPDAINAAVRDASAWAMTQPPLKSEPMDVRLLR